MLDITLYQSLRILSESGAPGCMHSLFRDLCLRSIFHSIANSKAKYGHVSCPRCE